MASRHHTEVTVAPVTRRSAHALESPWAISADSLESLKWVGLVLMAADHVNKYVLGEASASLYAMGRLVMPIFGFVLMYNLCRPGALAQGVHLRVMKRLAVFGALATPAFVVLVGWWPLNILFTLLAATSIVFLWERGGVPRRLLAMAVFLVGGAIVEFWWPALLCCLGAWAFVRRPSAPRLALWVGATASLSLINGNFAALVAIPLIWGARQVDIPMPRSRWAFYAFYPAHLTALAVYVALR
ncbi:MAG: conjugal transfer protein TraX [Variovorax paradoxus]|uniref:Conjugal transfer protein TraX n=1 Tax=Variovorax paradoxus TaxID=34073 RepID=A0A2W5SDM1_VARPD|nr:MAG: conjugal transfer protein TraX [Variovorax paradoxus]